MMTRKGLLNLTVGTLGEVILNTLENWVFFLSVSSIASTALCTAFTEREREVKVDQKLGSPHSRLKQDYVGASVKERLLGACLLLVSLTLTTTPSLFMITQNLSGLGLIFYLFPS